MSQWSRNKLAGSRDVVVQKNAKNPLASKGNQHRSSKTIQSEDTSTGHHTTTPATFPGPCATTRTNRALGTDREVKWHMWERQTASNIYAELETPWSRLQADAADQRS